MTEFKPRLTKPEKGNPYYNTVANGGWSPAIKGSPTDADCDVLSNCFTGDGCVDRYGCVSISTVKKTDAEKISDICSVLGYRNKITWEMRDTNYKEDSVLYRVVIKKSFLPAEVLLNPKHLERFSRISKDISFTRVAEVIDLEYEEDVYCVQEPETNQVRFRQQLEATAQGSQVRSGVRGVFSCAWC